MTLQADGFTHRNVDFDGTFTDERRGGVEPLPMVRQYGRDVTITTGRLDDATVRGVRLCFDTVADADAFMAASGFNDFARV